MSFTFLHTADWQIGRPFGKFDERKRTLLREARLTVVDRIAQVAHDRGAMHILVAGDVFDSPTVADRSLRQTMAKLAKHTRLTWHLLPGNHDPLRAGGIWDRMARIGLPANVQVHTTAVPVALGDEAVLLPAPLTASSSDRDPTAWMDSAETAPGKIRIGLAHGSVRGFGSAAEASQQISPTRPETARLTYLALGDWHGALRISDRIWYSGTPEPDRYPDNEPGYVLAVSISDSSGATGNAPVSVERVPVAHFHWTERSVLLEQATDWDRFAAETQSSNEIHPIPSDQHLLKVVLRGALTMTDRTRIEAALANLEHSLFHLETDMSALMNRPADDDLDAISDASVRAVAERLRAAASDDLSPERTAATTALRKLMRLDAEIGAQSARETA